jgi:hypothetical protein
MWTYASTALTQLNRATSPVIFFITETHINRIKVCDVKCTIINIKKHSRENKTKQSNA